MKSSELMLKALAGRLSQACLEKMAASPEASQLIDDVSQVIAREATGSALRSILPILDGLTIDIHTKRLVREMREKIFGYASSFNNQEILNNDFYWVGKLV